MTKQTKIVAQEVDADLLQQKEMIQGLLDEERENMRDLPDMTVDEWN